MVSSDEEDEQEDNSYEDSFIDDRINPTAKSTQAEESGIDMMAVYRFVKFFLILLDLLLFFPICLASLPINIC